MIGSRVSQVGAADNRKLGERLRRARERKGELTQSVLAKRVTDRLSAEGDIKGIQQTYIARLEEGKATPSKNVLRALAAELSVPYDYLLAALVTEQYGEEGRENIFFPLDKGVVTLSELAVWESNPGHKSVWLVAEKYIDNLSQEFFDAVSAIVARGDNFTFFVPEGQGPAIELYRHEIQQVTGSPVTDAELHFVPLSEDQLSLMAASFVLANPDIRNAPATGLPPGYLILNDETGEPCLGVAMSVPETRRRVTGLKIIMRNAGIFDADLEGEK